MNPGHHGRLVIAGVLACAVLLLGTGNLAGTPIGSGSHHPPLPAPVAGIVGSIREPVFLGRSSARHGPVGRGALPLSRVRIGRVRPVGPLRSGVRGVDDHTDDRCHVRPDVDVPRGRLDSTQFPATPQRPVRGRHGVRRGGSLRPALRGIHPELQPVGEGRVRERHVVVPKRIVESDPDLDCAPGHHRDGDGLRCRRRLRLALRRRRCSRWPERSHLDVSCGCVDEHFGVGGNRSLASAGGRRHLFDRRP